MSHYAFVDGDGVVTKCIVADQSFVDSLVMEIPGAWYEYTPHSRAGYKVNSDGVKQTDQPVACKNSASVGMQYDRLEGVFYQKQPYPSWRLDTTAYVWYPPVDHPNDGKYYIWDESQTSWILDQDLTDMEPEPCDYWSPYL